MKDDGDTIQPKPRTGLYVIPKDGPHAGQQHRITADHGDGTFTLQPCEVHPSDVKYRTGNVLARPDQFDVVNETFKNWNVEFNQGDRVKVIHGDHVGKRGHVVTKHDEGESYTIRHADGSKSRHHISTLSENNMETAQPINELSRSLLGRYVKTAAQKQQSHSDIAREFSRVGHDKTKSGDAEGAQAEFKQAGRHAIKAANRRTGINKAVDKLTKESIDESNNTPYVKEFYHKGSTKQAGWKASNKHGKVKHFGLEFKASAHRHAGIDLHEDIQIDELSKTTLNKYIDNASNDRTKQTGNSRKYHNRLNSISLAVKKATQFGDTSSPQSVKVRGTGKF